MARNSTSIKDKATTISSLDVFNLMIKKRTFDDVLFWRELKLKSLSKKYKYKK